ncbi:MAG: cation transporter [Firmicutes bacterium]|nr:cation transporter [Bacillota bacterium]
MDRNKVIYRTSIIGIAANILLAAFKAIVGLAANSIAIVLDAVNNLSDALSSVVTIIGTKLANRKPTRKHPLGHGRIEYLSTLVVAALVLYAGITSLVESVKKIIEPVEADYSIATLIIISAAVVVKIILGRYVKAQGEKVDSGSLIASGQDATFDAILSASVLLSAVIFMTTGLSLEAYVGLIISGFIIKSGIEMMMETLDDILGKRTDKELSNRIKALLREEEYVGGAYDLIINNYGPGRDYASVHLELPDTMTVEAVDRITRKVEQKIFRETGIVLVAVGVYSQNTKNDEAARMRDRIKEKILTHDWVIQMHGFYVDFEEKIMRFDAVLSFDIDPKKGIEILCEEVKSLYPGYDLEITPDVDLSD